MMNSTAKLSRLNTAMRYYELLEDLDLAERARRDAEKRRKATEKRNRAQKKRADAAFRYQVTMRAADDTIQSANNAMASIKSS